MKKSVRISLWLCMMWTCVFSQYIHSQEEKFNIDNLTTDLKNFIDFVARATNKQILYDNTLEGKKIYLVSPGPVTKDELYKIFLSVIEYNGYILEVEGTPGTGAEIIKIKRNIQGPWTPTPTIINEGELNKIGDQDHFITMVINLKYISAREVQTTLRALRIVNPQGGNLAGIEGSNSILLTDFAPNVKRIHDVIKLMDQEGPRKDFRVFRLKHAVAGDVAEQLKEFVKVDRQATGGFGVGPNLDEVKVIEDKRLNALVVQAYSATMNQMDTLIRELDQQLDDEPATIHYIRLKHADALKLEDTLNKLIEGGGFKPNAPKPGTVTSSTPESQLSVSVKAEPQTNSLIVQAEEHQWREIEKIIQQVDVRRPQVLIEAALVEVSPRDVLGLGVEVFWAEAPKDDRLTFSGGTGFGFSNLVTVDGDKANPIDPDATITGDRFGRVPLPQGPDPFSQGILGALNFDKEDPASLFSIPLIFRAIQTQGDFKVVSMPRILTNDNEQAEIRVTDKAPSDTTSQGSNNDITGFGGYQEAGTVLTITPHISGEKNYLRLELTQSIDEFDRSIVTRSGVPAIRSRKITTSVTVPNGHTIAIGGLTFDSMDEQIRKIPLLGDLPLLGILFQTRVITHSKRNVYLFVTPRILKELEFDDLLQYSYETKLDAQKFGVDMGKVDKSFGEYQKKYGFKEGELPPLYMLEYKSPSPANR